MPCVCSAEEEIEGCLQVLLLFLIYVQCRDELHGRSGLLFPMPHGEPGLFLAWFGSLLSRFALSQSLCWRDDINNSERQFNCTTAPMKYVNNTPHLAAHPHSASLNFSKNAVCVLLDFWGFFLLCAPGQRELARHSTVLRSFTVPSPASLCLLHTICVPSPADQGHSFVPGLVPRLLSSVGLQNFFSHSAYPGKEAIPKGWDSLWEDRKCKERPALGKEVQKGILCCCR